VIVLFYLFTRFEWSVPLVFAGSAAHYLESRSTRQQDFFVMKTDDFSTRLLHLVQQATDSLRTHMNNQPTQDAVVHFTVMLDLLRNCVLSGRYWGGLSGLARFLSDHDFSRNLQLYNLPHWGDLRAEATTLGENADVFASIINRLATSMDLPRSVDGLELLTTTWALIDSEAAFSQKMLLILTLYQKDLARLLRRSRSDRSEHYSDIIQGL
jgi:hypothetical protein